MRRFQPRRDSRSGQAIRRRQQLVESLENRTLLSVNVLTYHNDLARDGWNPNETILTPADVNSTSFGKLFSYNLDGQTYAQPLYASHLTIDGGVHNVVFVATEHNSMYALDADGTSGPNGGVLWHVNLGPSATVPNNDFGNRYGPYHDIGPEVGITSTPVIDPATGTMYVDAFTKDGPGQYAHYIHALDITSGAEKFGGPVLVQASSSGTGAGSVNGTINFVADQELQRPALTLFDGTVYVMYAGYADTDPYHGWILGFNASNLHLTTAFNVTPDGEEGGIWQSGNGLASDGTSLYVMTANGDFDTTLTPTGFPGEKDYGDSFLRLTAGGSTLTVSDYFTPLNQQSLANADEDLGSGGAMVLPDSVGSAAHRHLLVGTGKEGKVYLIDRDNMGKYSPSTDHVVQELPGVVNGTWSNPAYANGVIYYHGQVDVLKAFSIGNGQINPVPVKSTVQFSWPGATPSVSSNGAANGIVWEIQRGATEELFAFDASNISRMLYNSNQNPGRDALTPNGSFSNPQKFVTPTIADGHVFVGGNGAMYVLGLLSQPATKPDAPSNLVAAAQGASQVTLTWRDNSNNENAFKIQRSADGVNFTQVGTASANATTFTDASLNASTRYFYRVIATNVAGDSSPSNVASVTTGASTSPVDWYKFDETSGTTAVDSSGGNNGTLVGSPAPQYVAGRVGPDALSFSGNGVFNSTTNQSAVNVARDLSPVLGGTATLTAWVRTTQVGNNNDHVAPALTGVEQAGTARDIRWGFLDGSGHIGIEAMDGPSVVSTARVNDGQWHHIAITRNASTGQVAIYIDGTLNVAGTTAAGVMTARFSIIGAVTDLAGDGVTRTGATYFNGALDDLRIFNSVLGANDIATLGKVPSAPGNLTAGVASDTVIRLSWTNTSAFATGVKIERATSASGPFVQIGQVGAGVASFNDNSLTAGVHYFYRVRATASAGDSGYSNVASTTAMRPTVVGRFVFYNRSAFDGQNGTSNIADARAVATDKRALLPGQVASFANYTSYDKGINGINIDLANFAGTPSAADFVFKVGNNNNPSTWATAPAPSAVNVYPGQGINGTNRITILWADGSIKNTWLQVTMKADAVTGLAAPDVFYWGNEVGESGNSTTDANVDATDVAAAANDPHGANDPAIVTNLHDYNRDGLVDATDQAIARGNARTGAAALQLINLSTAPPANAGSITGRLFQDSNGNAYWDAGEIGIAGWTMYVDYNNNSRLDAGEPTATTAAAGFYTFNNIRPGEQIVRQLPQNGWTQTTPANNWGAHAVAVDGRTATAPFTGIRRSTVPPPPPPPGGTGTISGRLFQDSNGNAYWDAGEIGIAGWTMYVDYNNNGRLDAGEPTTATTAAGFYTFNNIQPGAETVRQLPPSGWVQTTPLNDAGVQAIVVVGRTVTTAFTGIRRATAPPPPPPPAGDGSISGTVFNDVNADNRFDSGDVVLSNWSVYADLNGNGIQDAGEPATRTNSAGNYTISNLAAGSYRMRAAIPAGWRQTLPAGNASVAVPLASGQARTGVSFGETRKAYITGVVFNDVNGNGLQQGEPGLGGWRVFVDANNDGVWESGEPSGLTDPSGNWFIGTLLPGSYNVRVATPSGWRTTTPATGFVPIVASDASIQTKVNFGEQRIG